MLFGKSQVSTINEVPAQWMLETYLGLGTLSGETIRMKSVFAPDSTHVDPLCLYYNKAAGEYRYKCWSSGEGGKIVNLLMALAGQTFSQTAGLVEAAYQQWLLSGHTPEALAKLDTHKWKVVHSVARSWTRDDGDFWSAYNVSSDLLTADLVRPLSEYAMLKFINEQETTDGFSVVGPRIYGYFTPDGVLYKIYQPMNREKKYLKVSDYLQGSHSLKGYPYLCVCSGMKDMLALKSLGLRVDYVAPDSENNLLSYEQLLDLKQRHHYQALFSLLDFDKTGEESMRDYEQFYGVPPCALNLEKDAALSIKRRGVEAVRHKLAPAIHRTVDLFTGLHTKPAIIYAY